MKITPAWTLSFMWMICVPFSSHAQEVVESVTAPGGKIVYYLMSLPGKDTVGNERFSIEFTTNGNKSTSLLLTNHPSDNPKSNLTGFKNLTLSPDSKTLYFQTDAWAVSDAIHAINLTTRKVYFVTDGEISCVILGGRYQGDLVVQQHRYFIGGGSYDNLWLFDPTGKEIGLVSEDTTDASKVCQSLEHW